MVELDMGSCSSDPGIVVDRPASKKTEEAFAGEMLKLNLEGDECILLKHRFYVGIGPLSQSCRVVDVHRNLNSSPMMKAQSESFRIFTRAMAAKRGGNPNVVHAWYGASRDEVLEVMKDGFRAPAMSSGSGPYGFGLHLCPELSVRESVRAAPVDDEGLRHLVVCRVILGNAEKILPGSTQSAPSSGNFDSGVDKEKTPSKYIVWYPDVKTNVLPVYAVSVKLDVESRGLQRGPAKLPSSPWMPFTSLLSVLAKFVPRSTMCVIMRLHTDFLEKKIGRQHFIYRVRQVTGDKLLVAAIKDFQEKRAKMKLRSRDSLIAPVEIK